MPVMAPYHACPMARKSRVSDESRVICRMHERLPKGSVRVRVQLGVGVGELGVGLHVLSYVRGGVIMHGHAG